MSSDTEQSRVVRRQTVEFIATAGYVGRIPWAPGTFGTVIGLLLAYILSYTNLVVYFAVVILGIGLAAWTAGQYERVTGRHDPKEVVIDEVVGYLVCVFLVPPTWPNLLIAFAVFRVLDILKPWPISWVDRKVPGGIGTVADDLAAGLVGLLFMHFVVAQLSFYF